MDQHTTAERYLAFWNEPDADRRASMIAEVYAPEASQTGPFVSVAGHEGIRDFSDQLIGHLSDYRFLRSGELEIHHDVMRLPWTLVTAEGARVFARGTDFGTFARDGRLCSISTFFDLVPEGVGGHDGDGAEAVQFQPD